MKHVGCQRPESKVQSAESKGRAIFEGYPIIWADVLTPYRTDATPIAALVAFGALGYWWFGEHGQPRMDFSSDVYFATDELAARYLKSEIPLPRHQSP